MTDQFSIRHGFVKFFRLHVELHQVGRSNAAGHDAAIWRQIQPQKQVLFGSIEPASPEDRTDLSVTRCQAVRIAFTARGIEQFNCQPASTISLT